tara:strand:- start:603 stop:1544 length:942 start_codon:yes stop_codon:yes gene_type:complete
MSQNNSDFKSSKEILKAYKDGFVGSWCDPEDTDKLLGELPHPLFGVAAPDLYHTGDGKLILLHKGVMRFDPTFGAHERQTTGDCVSHSTRSAVDATRAHEILFGETEEFVARGATEAIYGSRGHGGQGMSCSGAARFVHQNGGILVRKNYGFVDLSKYNSSIGINWGKSRGVPSEVINEAQKHQVQTISLVKSVQEARDAISNGYALSVCSTYGFSPRRDKNGIAKKSGSWNHAMAWIGVDDSHEVFKETLFLVQNSWGVWNGGPKRHDQPDGSFWIRERDASGMLNQNGAWAFSDVDGFPPRKVNWTIDEVF